MSEHERRYTRISFDATTHLEQFGHDWKVDLMDISLRGALIKQPNDWQINPGKPLILSVKLSADHQIHIKCHIVHVSPDTIGCEFDQIDLDSLSELKRLLELNMGSEEQLHRELTQLLQLGLGKAS